GEGVKRVLEELHRAIVDMPHLDPHRTDATGGVAERGARLALGVFAADEGSDSLERGSRHVGVAGAPLGVALGEQEVGLNTWLETRVVGDLDRGGEVPRRLLVSGDAERVLAGPAAVLDGLVGLAGDRRLREVVRQLGQM